MSAIMWRQVAQPDLFARAQLLAVALCTGVIAFALPFLAGCGGGGGGGGAASGSNNCVGAPGAKAVLQSLDITPANASVAVGKTLALKAIGHWSDGTCGEDITTTWSSATPSVATIREGLVYALATGSATITVTDSFVNVTGSATIAVTPGQAAVSYLFNFGLVPGGGNQPNGPLLQASDGNFYGTTRAGSSNTCEQIQGFCGVLFKITPTGAQTVLYGFGASASDGFDPTAPLLQMSDGNFYGTTSLGGANGDGTVFMMTPAGVETVLYSFGASPSDGVVPAALLLGNDGNFYGTTSSGGANYCAAIPGNGNNCGTVFKVTPAGVETVLYSFGASASDGFEPLAPLVQASDGNFYGTTSSGGAYGGGTVFRITPNGVETVLYSFGASPANGSPPQGFVPQGSLIQASDGNLYGTTVSGGAFSGVYCQYGCGTVFKITLDGVETVLYSFAGYSASDGNGPAPFLIQGSDGNFYGTTISGGAFDGNGGTAFKITPAGTETVLYSFGPLDINPSDPGAGIIQASDGAFYGVTTDSAGPNAGWGTVFKLTTQ